MANLVGKVLGKYRIEAYLGGGGMADVYRARQTNLERDVALKFMHPHLAQEADFLARFEREAKNIAALRHPNIVQVYDFDVDADSSLPYIVMELIEGPTLKQQLDALARRGETLPLPEALRITREVGQALAYAHQRHMVHRDVKPGNTMIDTGGRTILTDFGLSKIISPGAQSATGGFVGTPAYMAPEVGQGQAGDQRADLYALGVMLYEMTTGALPYQGDTAVAVMLMHITTPVPSPRKLKPDLPDWLESVILTSLAKEPEQRFQSVDEMLARLALYQAAAPAAGSPFATAVKAEAAASAPTGLPATRFGGQTAAAAQRGATLEIPPPPEPTLLPATLEFVGREAELAHYAAQLEQKHVAIICGFPGLGKTALAAALAVRVSEPARAFWHTFHEGEGVNVLLWKLAAFLAWHGQSDLWRMVQAGNSQPGQSAPMEVLFDYVFQALRGAGYLLCFDDYHFIEGDPLLQQFVGRLQRALQAGEMTLILASRQTPGFADETDCQPLTGLSPLDTQELLARRGLRLAGDQVEALHARTEGNAQFLTLSVENLRRSANPARLIHRLSESDSVERFLMKEVDDGLSDDEREVMGAVAVLLGYPGTRDAISVLLEGRGVRRTLNDLQSRHLVGVTEGDAGKQFGQHAMVREFYYDQLDKRVRQAMHRRAADYYAADEPDPLKAARHFQCAGEPAKAIQCAYDNVWTIINRGQARPLQQMLEQFAERDLDKVQWALVNLARGQVARFFEDLAAGRQSYAVAHAIFAAMPNSKNSRLLRARACLGLGELLRIQRPVEALEWLRRGMDELQGADLADEAALRIRLGSTLDYLGQRDEAQAELQRGLMLLAPEPGRLRLDALMNLGNSYCQQGKSKEGINHYQQALEMARSLDDRWRMAGILYNLGMELDLAGRFEDALQHYQQALELAEQLGNLQQQIWVLAGQGRTRVKMGDLAAAEGQFTRSIALARSKGWQGNLVYLLLDLIDAHVIQSKAAEAEPLLVEAMELAQATGVREPVPFLYANWALARLALNDRPKALEYAELAVKSAHEVQHEFGEGFTLRVLGQTQAALGQSEAAGEAFAQSLALLAGRDPLEAARTKVAYGRCLQAQGDMARGAVLLEEARSAFAQLGAQYDQRQLGEAPMS